MVYDTGRGGVPLAEPVRERVVREEALLVGGVCAKQRAREACATREAVEQAAVDLIKGLEQVDRAIDHRLPAHVREFGVEGVLRHVVETPHAAFQLLVAAADRAWVVRYVDGVAACEEPTASTLALTNAELPDKPAAKSGPMVRGYVVCTYVLTELSPTSTNLQLICNLDPMGLFPFCLATAYGGAYPGMMLKRIKAQSLKLLTEKSSAP